MAPSRLHQAFDELQFGPSKTLNLREHLPTAEQAVARAEAWLRERQVARAGEVLVITGRGAGSEGGVPVVREAVAKLLVSLRRRGVVTAVREHTPGSFVVRLAPVTALFDGGARKRDVAQREVERARVLAGRDPVALHGLEPETRRLLRLLAERSLETLGAPRLHGRFVIDEMVRQFGRLAAAVAPGDDRDLRFRSAIRLALAELDEDAADTDD